MNRKPKGPKTKLHPLPRDPRAAAAIKTLVAKHAKFPPKMPPTNKPPSERRIVIG